ncbi:MAG: SDR family oxidoreductase [Halanaeroarchaeum sp.]
MIFVTGATGTVGRHVASELADRDASVRLGLRRPDRVPNGLAPSGDVVTFDFEQPETWGRALDDVDRLFLLRPPGVDASTIGAFAEAAARVGVEHVVYLSGYGAGRNPLNPHFWSERRIVAADIDHTLLRAAYFAQNLAEVHRTDVVERDEIFVPAGDGEASFVDARDVGAVAATALTEPGHANRAYDVTGPAALDFDQVATIFSDVLGREITYPDPSLREFVRRTRQRGTSTGYLLLLSSIYTAIRLGFAGRVSGDAERILGREPRRLATFVEDYAEEFR